MKKIEVYGKGYLITESGEVYNKDGKKLKLNRWGTTDYLCACLCHKGKAKTFGVHRLVAIAYIPNPENKPCVNHKDGNKKNNHVSNLEWVTHGENMLHSSYDLGNTKGWAPMTGKFGSEHNKSKEILILTPDGVELKFGSAAEMARETGYSQTAVSEALKTKSLPYTFRRGKNKGMTVLEYNRQQLRKK